MSNASAVVKAFRAGYIYDGLELESIDNIEEGFRDYVKLDTPTQVLIVVDEVTILATKDFPTLGGELLWIVRRWDRGEVVEWYDDFVIGVKDHWINRDLVAALTACIQTRV